MEACADVVIAIDCDAQRCTHGVSVIDDELGCIAVVSLLDEGDFHAINKVVVIAVHVEHIHQMRKVTHGIDMAVEVAIHIAEGVIHRMAFLDGAQAADRIDGARQIGNVFTDVTKLGYVHAGTGTQIDDHPDRAHITQRIALGIIQSEIALREVPVIVLNPCGERVVLVDFGIGCQFDGHTREHPNLVVLYQTGITSAP